LLYYIEKILNFQQAVSQKNCFKSLSTALTDSLSLFATSQNCTIYHALLAFNPRLNKSWCHWHWHCIIWLQL